MATVSLPALDLPFESIPERDLPERFEVVDGKLVELNPLGANEGLMANELKRLIDLYLNDHAIGKAVAEILFDLRPGVDRSRQPDVSFVSFERWPRGKRVPSGPAWPVVPDLAVEFVSPNDLATNLIDKVHEYFAAGCRRVWVVYPNVEQVYEYESPSALRIHGRGATIDGGDILPGFSLTLAEVFGPEEGEVD